MINELHELKPNNLSVYVYGLMGLSSPSDLTVPCLMFLYDNMLDVKLVRYFVKHASSILVLPSISLHLVHICSHLLVYLYAE